MERVGVLINKLNEQLQRNAEVHNMLVTTQLLQKELLSIAGQANGFSSSKVSVMVPNAIGASADVLVNDDKYKPVPPPQNEPEPIKEPIAEPEAPLPASPPVPTPKPEPEPIPHFVEQDPYKQVFAAKEEKSRWALDPVLEIPTLAHQQQPVYELNDAMVSGENSINERLKQNKAEMGSRLQEVPIRDLKKAISINDRHRFINELFRGDETMYERSIKTINSFNISAEAEYWIERELKVKLGWNGGEELVKTFDQLVRRRFA
jgi:hypothetical protein